MAAPTSAKKAGPSANKSAGPKPGGQARTPLKKKVTLQQLWTLLRRLLVFVAAIVYIYMSIAACVDSLKLLRDIEMPAKDYRRYDSALIAQYAGTTTIRESPMFAAIQDDLTPRSNGSLYLEDTTTSLLGCTGVNTTSQIYDDTFQRTMFASIRNSLAYNLTQLNPQTSELIMPVIDCTFTPLQNTDASTTAARFFYLMRAVQQPHNVFLLAVTMSVQEYQVTKQKARGSAAVATIAFITDMRATAVEHHFAVALGYPFEAPRFQVYDCMGLTSTGYWVLQSVRADPRTEAVKILTTSRPTGSFIASPNEQANIVYLTWRLPHDPASVLAHWQWTGCAVAVDSWGWVHFLHIYFALSAIFGLVGLLTVVYYNVRAGKIWVGDAFVAIASPHWLRSALVLVSWHLSEYWTLAEFALVSGDALAPSPRRTMTIYPSVLRADVLALYISLASSIGELTRERIDPALTIALFIVGFDARLAILRLFPSLQNTLVAFADRAFYRGVKASDAPLYDDSPLRVWSSSVAPPPSAAVVASALFPIVSTLVGIVWFVALRKVARRVWPDLAAQQPRSSANSSKEGGAAARSKLTQFEFATGVELRDRFGVVSDYTNYVHIKGMRFASADGIYTSGFVIANGAFLVAIDDLQTILLIKLTRVRFRNVFVYDVDGNAVKQTARLVYPSTLALIDIMRLNLKVLM